MTVTLSTPVSTITVPDVLGRTRPDAEQFLGAAELRMVEGQRRPSPGRPDLVLEQDPRPGAQATRGSAVSVVISVPEGMRIQWPVAAAAAASALAGVGAVRWLRSKKPPPGKAPQVRMSLGGSRLDAMEKAAIDYAVANGVIVVASAGNRGLSGMGYTGDEPVISVGASGWLGEWFSGNWWYGLR